MSSFKFRYFGNFISIVEQFSFWSLMRPLHVVLKVWLRRHFIIFYYY